MQDSEVKPPPGGSAVSAPLHPGVGTTGVGVVVGEADGGTVVVVVDRGGRVEAVVDRVDPCRLGTGCAVDEEEQADRPTTIVAQTTTAPVTEAARRLVVTVLPLTAGSALDGGRPVDPDDDPA
jgi:hypothetical protein